MNKKDKEFYNLLSCPFCSYEPEVYFDGVRGRIMYTIRCQRQKCIAHNIKCFANTIQEAIDEWNIRDN